MAGPQPLPSLLARDSSDHRVVTRLRPLDMVGHALALLLCQRRQHRENAAQRHRDVINVVHSSDCFARERHALVLLRIKVPSQSKRSRPALPASTLLPQAYRPRHPPSASPNHRDRSSPSTRKAGSQSPDGSHPSRTANSNFRHQQKAYSSAPRSPDATHPTRETRKDSQPTGPPPESSPRQYHRHDRFSADKSARSHAPR